MGILKGTAAFFLVCFHIRGAGFEPYAVAYVLGLTLGFHVGSNVSTPMPTSSGLSDQRSDR